MAHDCFTPAYGGKRMYPQVIEEWKSFSQLSGDRNDSEFASAMEPGFRSGGWKGALTKGIEIRQAQRKTGYSSGYEIATLYADLGEKDHASQWLNNAYQERDAGLDSLELTFHSIRYVLTYALLSWYQSRASAVAKLHIGSFALKERRRP